MNDTPTAQIVLAHVSKGVGWGFGGGRLIYTLKYPSC